MVIVLLWFLAMKNVAIAGLGVTYIRSTGEHAPATIVGPSTRLERVSIPYPLMGSKDMRTMLNSIAFGKSTSQRIYPRAKHTQNRMETT